MSDRLPIRQPEGAVSSCAAVAGGLSREELALAEEALMLKAQLRAAHRAAELAVLRERWAVLEAERHRAWRRKMIALGHFPPDAT